MEKDVDNGSLVLQYFAVTAAWAGDKELALQQLEAGLRAPDPLAMLSYGALKLFPVWDPLRGDPRFEQNRRRTGAETIERIFGQIPPLYRRAAQTRSAPE